MSEVLGLTLSCGSAFASASGQTLQRLSRLRAEQQETMPPPWMRPMWYWGILLYAAASFLDMASLVFAGQSLVVVIYALRLPLVALMANLFLGARISKTCWLGIILTAGGAGVSMVFRPQIESRKDFEDAWDFFTTPVMCYLGVSVLAWISLGSLICKARGSESSSTCSALMLPLLAAWVMTTGNLFNAGLGRVPADEWLAMEWIWLSGATGGFSMAGGGLNLLGVEHQSTHIFVPAVFGFQAFLMGIQGVLAGDFDEADRLSTILWAAGMVGAIVGTIFVSLGSQDEPKEARDPQLSAELAAAGM